jgi:branched-chain amino acid transport system substrate-binding protein
VKRKSTISIAAICAAMALCLAGCAGAGSSSTPASTGAATKGDFHIVVIGDLTGPVAPTNADITLGMTTAATMINAAGGIHGEKVTVSNLDDQSDPTQAVTQLQNLITSGQKVDLVYPGIGDSESLAMLPLLTQNKMFSMAQTTSAEVNDPTKYPYHFGIEPTNAASYSAIGTTLKSKGYKKIGIIVPDTAYGTDLISTVKTLAKSAGTQVVATDKFDPAGVDFTVDYQRVLAAKPDVIFMDSTGDSTIGDVFKARAAAGGMNVPLLVGNGSAAVNPSKVAPASTLAGCMMPVFKFTVKGGVDAAEQKLMKPLVTATKEHSKTGGIFLPGIGFDLVRTAALGANRAKTADTSAIVKEMSTLSVPKDYSVQYPDGFSYSSKSHFPEVKGAFSELIPCTSTTNSDGLWQVQ